MVLQELDVEAPQGPTLQLLTIRILALPTHARCPLPLGSQDLGVRSWDAKFKLWNLGVRA